MEWRNGIAWTPPLTFVVDPWLSLVGSISALARLTLTDCVILFSYSTVAVTGRKHLRPRPVDFVILFSYSTVAVTGRKDLRPRPVDFVILFSVLDPWLLLAGDISVLARLILLFYLFSLLNLWLLLAGGISAIARLDSFIFG